MALRISLTCAFALASATAAFGQAITLNPIQVSGTILQIGAEGIAIKAANGQKWLLKTRKDRTNVRVTGTAGPEVLIPGMCVRFTARIDKRTCKAQEKIDKVTIFTQSPGVPERTLGIQLAGERPPEKQKEGNVPGKPQGRPGRPGGPPAAQARPPAAQARPPAAQAGAADEFGIPTEEPPGLRTPKRRGGATKGADKAVPDVASYDVCAQVVSLHAGRLVVNVQNRFFKPKITAELSADAQIDLDLGDISIAKPGDKLSATGYYVTLGTCELTTEVEITLANPLVLPGSRSHRPRPSAHAADATRGQGGKSKPAAGAKKNAGAAEEKAPADAADPAAAPPEKDNPPAKTEPEARPEPAPPDDNVMPPPDDSKPEAKKPEPKKPDKEPEKKPPVTDDDEKDVSDK